MNSPPARRLARRAPANFDSLARVYRWAEYLALGPLLQLTRKQLLPCVLHARQALLLGDGDGRFTVALLRAVPRLRAHAVDTSGAMLRLLEARVAKAGAQDRLTTRHASALNVVASPDTDLVVTHFFLDCMAQTEVEELAARLAAQLQPGCLWLLSDFGLPAHAVLRPIAAAYIRLLYLAFRVLAHLGPQRLPDPRKALATAGFVRLEYTRRLAGLLYSELWQLAPTRDPGSGDAL